MNTITPDQYDAVCHVIDRVKTDDRHEDTDAYASSILAELGLVVTPGEPDESERTLASIPYGADISIHIVETIDYRQTIPLVDLIEAADPDRNLSIEATLSELLNYGSNQSGFDEWLEKNGDVRGQERSVKVVQS